MRIFMTGATGFVGQQVLKEFVEAGHDVLALVRSGDKAPKLQQSNVTIFEGSLSDLARLKEGASQADAVAHLAFNHDFSEFVASAEADKRAVEALGEGLGKSGGALLVTSGTLAVKAQPGRPAVETDPHLPPDQMPRALSEVAAEEMAEAGVRAFVLRPGHVHDVEGRGGALAWLVDVAREKGFSAYATDGQQRWPACARPDLARLYRLAIEKGVAGQRYHGVSEEGVRMRDIAEAVGRLQGVPTRSLSLEEANAHFGPTASFVTGDGPASSTLTQEWLGWTPEGNGMIADIDAMPRA